MKLAYPLAASSRAAELARDPRRLSSGSSADVFVDCDHGSDAQTGAAASTAVATLERARALVQTLRRRP